VKYSPEVKAAVLTALAVHSGHLSLRHFEAVETETEIPAGTIRGWAGQAGMIVVNRTGKRGRPPGSCGTRYERRGADSIPKVEGRTDLPESAYRLSPQEMDKLDWFVAKHEPLTWNESFTVRLAFD